jgi:hypothetical protein
MLRWTRQRLLVLLHSHQLVGERGLARVGAAANERREGVRVGRQALPLLRAEGSTTVLPHA